ncbi:MAG: hypothetical protein ACI9QD_000135 [Thermoproteota archaeon]|jgi:hypothetical protein
MRTKSLLDNKTKGRDSLGFDREETYNTEVISCRSGVDAGRELDRILPKNCILIFKKSESDLIYIVKYHNESIKNLYQELKDYPLLL